MKWITCCYQGTEVRTWSYGCCCPRGNICHYPGYKNLKSPQSNSGVSMYDAKQHLLPCYQGSLTDPIFYFHWHWLFLSEIPRREKWTKSQALLDSSRQLTKRCFPLLEGLKYKQQSICSSQRKQSEEQLYKNDISILRATWCFVRLSFD